MATIDLNKATGALIKEKAIEQYSDRWLHVLSKVTQLSQSHINALLEQNHEAVLSKEFINRLAIMFNDESTAYLENTILSPFEITQIRKNEKTGNIDFIEILFRGVKIHLNFFGQKSIPTISECINMMNTLKTGVFLEANFSREKDFFKCAERWLSILQTFDEEGVDFNNQLLTQQKYIENVNCFVSPVRFDHQLQNQKNIQLQHSSLYFYEKKNEHQRYIKANGPIFSNMVLIFLAKSI